MLDQMKRYNECKCFSMELRPIQKNLQFPFCLFLRSSWAGRLGAPRGSQDQLVTNSSPKLSVVLGFSGLRRCGKQGS